MTPIERSPFLDGALAWLYAERVPDRCEQCGYAWLTDAKTALHATATAPDRHETLLDGRDGAAPAADGGWNATADVWHLSDLVRWSR